MRCFARMLLCAAPGALFSAACSTTTPPQLLLEIAETDIRGGATVTHSIELPTAGEIITIELTQRLIDCDLSIESPLARRTILVNSPGEQSRRDSLAFRVSVPGAHLVRVRPLASPRVHGRYAMKISRLPARSRLERSAAEGELLLTAAAATFAKGSETHWRESLQLYSDAAQTFSRAGLETKAANAKLSASLVALTKLTAWTEAARYGREAVDELLDAEDFSSAALAARVAATAEQELALAANSPAQSPDDADRWRESQRLYEKAFAALRVVADPVETALTINQHGILLFYMHRYDEAREAFATAMRMANSVEFTLGELKAAQNLAFLDFELGFYERAASGLDEVAALLETTGELAVLADVLDNSGLAHSAAAHLDASLQRHLRALALHRTAHDGAGEARSLHGIGRAYLRAGDAARALGFLLQALPLRKQHNDQQGLVATLLAIGAGYAMRNDWKHARSYVEQAVDASHTPREQIRSLVELSRLELHSGRPARALALADRAFTLGMPPAHPVLTQARLERGKALLQLGEHERASAELETARKTFARSHAVIQETEALLALTALAEARGARPEALRLLDVATAQIERMRERAVNPELRARYLASQAAAFEARTQLLMKLAGLASTAEERSALITQALLNADRSRARTLRDASASQLKRGGSPEKRSGRERMQLLNRISAKHLQVDELREKEGADQNFLRTQEDQLRLMQAQLDLLLREDPTPAYAPVGLDDLRRLQQILPVSTAIVFYSLGNDEGWAWVVLREGIHSVRIPSRRAIDKLAHRYYADESAVTRSGAGARTSAAALSEAVIEPLLPYLSAGRVLFALDGALHYVPFASLPISSHARRDESHLIERFEISVFGSLGQLTAASVMQSARPTAWQREMLLVAHPVFTADDSRVSARARLPASRVAAQSGWSPSSGSSRSSLPATEVEARAILSLFPHQTALALLGFDASRDRVLLELSRGARVIHFATHAFADTGDPRLSYIALSGVDRYGSEMNGTLLAGEIASSQTDAELVILSACETHIGEQLFGEGLRGLSHAWVRAGADTVVGSLWKVSDQATRSLMVDFYSAFDRGRVRPAAALRAAQLRALKHDGYREPYYWAAFVPLVTSMM
jgi:CHAT domain-containing protein